MNVALLRIRYNILTQFVIYELVSILLAYRWLSVHG